MSLPVVWSLISMTVVLFAAFSAIVAVQLVIFGATLSATEQFE